MSRISLLTLVGALLLTPVVAQAEAIPLLKNLTTGATVFHDNFEGDTIGAYPAADTGTWTVDKKHASAEIKVTNYATSGISAYQGDQFLKTYGADGVGFGLRGAGTAATGASDVIEMQIAFHQTEGGLHSIWPMKDASTYLLVVGLAASYSTFTNEVIYVGSAGVWTGTGLTYARDTWNTLKVTHTNGTTAWAISLNGGDPVNVSGCDTGLTNTWDQFSIAESAGTTTTYFDAVPEPGALVLLATGLVGLLCYAWRKRK